MGTLQSQRSRTHTEYRYLLTTRQKVEITRQEKCKRAHNNTPVGGDDDLPNVELVMGREKNRGWETYGRGSLVRQILTSPR